MVNAGNREAGRKRVLVQIRMTAEQKRIIEEAAGRTGLKPSTWLRALALREARRLGVK
jgi:uncharacterized protein (DUF1778 family)